MIIVTNNSIFGENLKFIRERNGFTPWYMAKLLNVSEERLHQLETGEHLEEEEKKK